MRNCERMETKGETEKCLRTLIAAAAASYSGLQTNFSYSEINEFLVTHKPHSDKNLEGAEAKED